MRERVAKFFNLSSSDELIDRLNWLGLFNDEKISKTAGATRLSLTPAQILQQLIEQKWMMLPNDIDMIVMRHEIKYSLANTEHCLISTLVEEGEDSMNTAMAKTVGLPMAVMVRLLMHEQIFLTGVHIPVMSQVYEPVLHELEKLGIRFEERMQSEALE